jgi:ABC-type protease/lipase transport system fused ATPase/permease subunit
VLLALDEPTAHVDLVGEQMFAQGVEAARKRGAIIILAGNANALVQVATHVLVMRDGTMLDFGPKDEVRVRMAERRKRIKTEQEGARPASAAAEADPQPVNEPEPSS